MNQARPCSTWKALTIQQPWASLIATGAKRLETRSWPTSYRGPLAIHAGVRLALWRRIVAATVPYRADHLEPAVGAMLRDLGLESVVQLPRGGVIAVATLVDCVPVEEIAFAENEREWALGDYTADRFAWRLEGVRRLSQTVRCSGEQGRIWTVSRAVARQIERERAA